MKRVDIGGLLTKILQRINGVGTLYRSNSSASCPNSTSLQQLSYSYKLPAGRWIVNYSIRFNTSVATGTRGTSLGANSTQYGSSYASGAGLAALQGFSGSACFMFDEEWTLNFYARQNSGAATTVDIFWDAIRVTREI